MNQTRLEAPRPGSAEYWQAIAADRGEANAILRERLAREQRNATTLAYIGFGMAVLAGLMGVLAVVK